MRAWKKVLCQTGQYKTEHDSTLHDKTEQFKTFQVFICADWQIAQNRTEQNKTKHDKTPQNITSIFEGFISLGS